MDEIFGPYRILELIGQGGMGSAYKAVDTRDNTSCVVKFLTHILSRSPEHLERFFREARATARIDHPGIVRYRDSGKIGDRHYLCVEFVEGVTLESHRAAGGGRLTPEESVRLILQIAGAVRAAHDAGIVHRDLTARNVLVTPDGGVKVIDFGIARIAEEATITVTGKQFGTPAHMAPEQFGAAAPVDPRIDVWAAGVLFYHLLTGKKPFDGETPIQVIQQIINPKFRPALPSECVQDLDPRFDRLTLWFLRKDPEMRPASFDVVIDALEGKIDAPTVEEYFSVSAAAASAATAAPAAGPPARRSRSVRWIAAAGVVLVAAAVGWVAARRGSSSGVPVERTNASAEKIAGGRVSSADPSTGLPAVCSMVLMEDPRLVQIYGEGKSILQIRPAVGGVKPGKVFLFHPRKTTAESLKLKESIQMEADPQEGEEMALRYVGVSIDNVEVGPDEIRCLAPFSHYELSNLLDRVQRSRATIFATTFRVYKLSAPVVVSRQRARLWIRLDQDIPLTGAVPVLPDAAFEDLRAKILKCVSSGG